jgi:hypothetical protein
VFTRLRLPQVPNTGNEDWDAFAKAIVEHLRSLEGKGALAIEEANILASYGIKFPATQLAQSDANTLDDYEEGTWTPVLSFATPGNLSVAYTTQYGDHEKIGRFVVARFNIVTSTFTHTTASGNLTVSGLPFASTSASGFLLPGVLTWQGITKAGYTQVNPYLSTGATAMAFLASGSGVSNSDVAFGDVPTGGSVSLRGCLTYRV